MRGEYSVVLRQFLLGEHAPAPAPAPAPVPAPVPAPAPAPAQINWLENKCEDNFASVSE